MIRGEMSQFVEDDPKNGMRAAGPPHGLLMELLAAIVAKAEPHGMRVTGHQLIAARQAIAQGVQLEVIMEPPGPPDRMKMAAEPVYLLRLEKP